MLRKFIVLAAAGVLVSLGLAWQAWELWNIRQGKFIDNSRLKVQVASQRSAGLGMEQIAAMHLFGNAADKPLPPPQPAELPKTDLKLVLVGAITDTDPKLASAIIDADRQVKRYFVGDSIPGGAVLHDVLADSVVLKRENRYETLGFEKAGDAMKQVLDSARKTFQSSAPVPVTPVPPAPVLPQGKRTP
ncbi:MAG TPA: type II secretion system protein N [Pseudomonadales bacterium]|nr:type II secretion system protein N [Pseudomonadales bacterium]